MNQYQMTETCPICGEEFDGMFADELLREHAKDKHPDR